MFTQIFLHSRYSQSRRDIKSEQINVHRLFVPNVCAQQWNTLCAQL